MVLGALLPLSEVGEGWAGIVGVVAGGLATPEPEPASIPLPLVMVKVGEMLPELPITAMIYVSLSGYEGTLMTAFPAVMGMPLARGDLSCRL